MRSIHQCRTPLAVLATAVSTVLGCTSPGSALGPAHGSPAVSVVIAPGDTDIAINGILALSARVSDSSGLVTSDTLTWSSSDTTVARVSSTGVVTGIAAGIVRVSATTHSQSAHAIVGVMPPEATPDASAPALAVDATAGRHAISPLIYGVATFGLNASYLQDLGIPITRWGGDGITRYNWQTDASNAGNDWYFMAGGSNSTVTPSGSADAMVDRNLSVGVQTFLAVPIIDYVNSVPSTRTDCTFPTSIFGTQQAANPYVSGCGNGVTPGGSVITPTLSQILRIHVANSANLQQGWIQHLTSKYGSASKGGVQIYAMDNEPSGWGNTHRDVSPGQITYQDLVQRTFLYGGMIKSVDPTAQLAGPEDFGWAVYVGTPSQNGGLWNAWYYLQQMQQYQTAHGTRLLDMFTEHFYASPAGVVTFDGTPGTAAVQAARLRSTRSLWDSTYVEENWIGQWYPPIQLIRTFHSWVNQYYPGTKIGITEYNWGGLNSINGALAQADVLGIFGRESLDMATLWGPPQTSWVGANSFRIYRNYDGAGGHYGETWVSSTSGDQTALALYGAQRTADSALTLIAINKTANDIHAAVSLADFPPGGPVQVYQLTPSNPASITRAASRWVHLHGFTQTYPANSITLLVIPPRIH
jgi:hypothetical protein